MYLAHLDDKQRMFFVTLLLHAVVGWSRKLSGSEKLAAATRWASGQPRRPRSSIASLLGQRRDTARSYYSTRTFVMNAATTSGFMYGFARPTASATAIAASAVIAPQSTSEISS